MSAMEYANQKFYEAWLCLFDDPDDPASLKDRVRFALTTLVPGTAAVTEVVATLNGAQSDWRIIQAAYGAPYDAEAVQGAIVRLDRRLQQEVAHSARHEFAL